MVLTGDLSVCIRGRHDQANDIDWTRCNEPSRDLKKPLAYRKSKGPWLPVPFVKRAPCVHLLLWSLERIPVDGISLHPSVKILSDCMFNA